MNKTKLLPAMLTFAEVVKLGSFTAAAKGLGLSKSAVSQQLARLEAAVGAQLVKRNTRGLSVTAVGQKLLERCDLLQDQVDQAMLELGRIEEQPSGTFSITFPHSLERDVAIPALRQLCSEYPGIQPRVLETDDKLDLVQEKLDVALFGGEPRDSNYRALPIGTMTEILCATPTYLQQHDPLESLENLVNHRWIATHWQKLTQHFFVDDRTDKLDSDPINIKISPFAQASTLPCAIEMAKQHMGLLLLPNVTGLPLIQNNTMVRVLERFRGPRWPFYFIHPFVGEKPAHVARYYQLVSHYFSKRLRSL